MMTHHAIYDWQRSRSMPDTSRVKALFGLEATPPFEVGLRRTFEWYRRSRYMSERLLGLANDGVKPQGENRHQPLVQQMTTEDSLPRGSSTNTLVRLVVRSRIKSAWLVAAFGLSMFFFRAQSLVCLLYTS